MHFEDTGLVERVKGALQALFQKQQLMVQLGIRLGDSSDPFAASTLFTAAFEITLQYGRARDNPNVVLVDPSQLLVLLMKPSYLDREDMIQDLSTVLPDLLQPSGAEGRGGVCARVPLPKARWKELFISEPASISAMEQQLVKLVEQALWAMALDPTLEAERGPEVADAAAEEAPASEDWIDEIDMLAKKSSDAAKKQKNRKKRFPSVCSMASTASASSLPVLEPTAEEDEEDDADASPSVGQNQFTALADMLDADSVPFEPWMAELAGMRRKNSKRKKRASAAPSLEPMVEEVQEGDLEDAEENTTAAGEDAEGTEFTETSQIPPEECSPSVAAASQARSEEVEQDDASSRWGTVALSPTCGDTESDADESVGTGIFHMAGDASDYSVEFTAASTPVAPNMFHMPCDASDLSRAATTASTPAAADPARTAGRCAGGRQGPPSHPASPLARHRAMPPRALVCYIWQQTSQFEDTLDGPPDAAATPAAGPAGPAGCGGSMNSSPRIVGRSNFSRGSWLSSDVGTPLVGREAGSPVLTAVVRNTFVELEDPTAPPRPQHHGRPARSLSPSLCKAAAARGESRCEFFP